MGLFEDRYRQDKETLTNHISLYKNEASAQQQIERFRGIGRYWMDMFMAQREMNSNVTRMEEANNIVFNAGVSELDPNMDRTGTLQVIEGNGWQRYTKPLVPFSLYIVTLSNGAHELYHTVKRTNSIGYLPIIMKEVISVKYLDVKGADTCD